MLPDSPTGAPASSSLPLAQGELAPADAAERRALKLLLHDRLGLHIDGYKEKCLRRRIAVRMRACAVHTYAAYGEVIEADEAERRRLLDTVTINVSKFFRNADTWEVLRREVVPTLFALPDPEIRIWSAGAAGGEEAYSMAILLREHAERHGGDVSRFRIRGTDIDRQSLEDAGRGEYGEFAFTELDDARRARWFEWADGWRVRDEVRAMVEFTRHDLMRDAFPRHQHLVLCRNVIIYFERVIQHALFDRFREALVPGGYLVLGKVEAMFGQSSRGFNAVAGRERVFRRL
jgi:chemotaxis protein methyltransferase CheR